MLKLAVPGLKVKTCLMPFHLLRVILFVIVPIIAVLAVRRIIGSFQCFGSPLGPTDLRKNSDFFLDRNGYCSPKPHPIKACTFARTSANSSADTLPLRLAFRTRQSTLLIWSDSTTLGTAAEIGTSKG